MFPYQILRIFLLNLAFVLELSHVFLTFLTFASMQTGDSYL